MILGWVNDPVLGLVPIWVAYPFLLALPGMVVVDAFDVDTHMLA